MKKKHKKLFTLKMFLKDNKKCYLTGKFYYLKYGSEQSFSAA